jgi:hypothetical protein
MNLGSKLETAFRTAAISLSWQFQMKDLINYPPEQEAAENNKCCARN